jgi:hypothetical protein
MVDSGYGVHLYWVFTEPLIFDPSPETTTQALAAFSRNLVMDWNKMFQSAFEKQGFSLDPTSLTQILRVPGSLNAKDERDRKVVQISGGCGKFYRPGDLHNVIATYEELNREVSPTKDFIKPILGVGLNPAEGVAYDITVEAMAEIPKSDLEAFMDYEPFAQAWTHGLNDKYPSQSERDLAIAVYLLVLGCTPQEVVNGLIHNRRANNQELKLRLDYYQRTLYRAEQSAAVAGQKITEGELQPEAIAEEVEASITEPSKNDSDTETRDAYRRSMLAQMGIHIDKLVKFNTDPPSYRLDFIMRGKEMSVTYASISELTSQAKFTEAIMSAANVFIPRKKNIMWNKFLAILIPFTTNEYIGELATATGVFKAKLQRYVNASAHLSATEGMEDSGAPQLEDAGEGMLCYIDPESFQQWHNTSGTWEKIRLESIARMMSDIGGVLSKFKGGKRWRFVVERGPLGLIIAKRREKRGR